jgi:hypothetical protein
MTTELEFDQQAAYRIIIKGVLDPSWSDWFDGLSISTQEGNTILIGIVPDQSALHGILAKINDLGLSIISMVQMTK